MANGWRNHSNPPHRCRLDDDDDDDEDGDPDGDEDTGTDDEAEVANGDSLVIKRAAMKSNPRRFPIDAYGRRS